MIIALNKSFWHPGYDHQVGNGILNYAWEHPDIRVYMLHERPLFRQETPPRIDGVIGRLWDKFRQAPPLQSALEEAPKVNVYEPAMDGTVNVVMDCRAQARMAFAHFRRLGLRHLAVLDSARFKGTRCEPFVEVCREHGYIPYVFRFGGRLKIESEEAQHRRLLRQLKAVPKPTGLYLTLDNHYAKILELCAEAGIRIPQDLAVLGMQNYLTCCLNNQPPLSSIDPDGTRIGYVGMELLVRMIQGETVPEETRIQPRELIARESTNFVLDEHPDITKVLDYLHTNLDEPFVIDDLVARQPRGRRAFEKRFRKACGASPRQYLISLRLDKARHLLETTTLSVTEIARQCGFSDVAYLGLVFRKRYGMAPLEYQRDRCGRHNN